MKLIYKTKSQYNGTIIQLAKETKQKSTDDGIVSEFCICNLSMLSDK